MMVPLSSSRSPVLALAYVLATWSTSAQASSRIVTETVGVDGNNEVAKSERVVLGLVDMADIDPQQVDRTLDSYLADLGVNADVVSLPMSTVLEVYEWARREASADGTRAVYWLARAPQPTVDLDGRLHVLLPTDPSRIYVRDLSLAQADRLDLLLESLAAIVRASTVSIDQGVPQGLRELDLATEASPTETPTTPTNPVTVQPSTVEPSRRLAVVLAAGYRGTTLDPGVMAWQHGLGLELDVAAPDRNSPLVGISVGGWAWPASSPRSELEVRRVALGLRGGYRFRPGRAVAIDTSAGSTVERLVWQFARPVEATGDPANGGRFRLAVDVDVALHGYVTREFGVVARVGAHVWLVNVDIVVWDSARTSRTILFPSAASGDTTVGLFYTF